MIAKLAERITVVPVKVIIFLMMILDKGTPTLHQITSYGYGALEIIQSYKRGFYKRWL
jgi:hypothetical protein